jgi:hypothetical protein
MSTVRPWPLLGVSSRPAENARATRISRALKGGRCWCPIWPRKEAGARVYLPAPDAWGEVGDAEEPPEGFQALAKEVGPLGLKPAWTLRYNGGANPLGVTLQMNHLDLPVVKELMEASWRALP